MQEYAVPNMQKICTICTNEICNIYVLYASIYKNMQILNLHLWKYGKKMQIPNLHLYGNIHMHIYIYIYAKKYVEICKLNMHKYAFLKYA